jgi:HlyD family secretion protein
VIVAPIAGTILEKLAEEGEIIREGTTLFTIADLKRMTLKIYLPGNEVGRIRLKDPAYVKIDAYPKERFKGTVAFIASKAEFTPKYVKTEQEQAAQVFEVKIDLPNPEGKLKPGLPANVTLERK